MLALFQGAFGSPPASTRNTAGIGDDFSSPLNVHITGPSLQKGGKMMDFIEAIQADQLPVGTTKSIPISGEDILLVNYKGKYYATGASCTHRGADLSKGKLKGKLINCPLHGSRFDVTIGICKAGPRINILRSATDNIPTYEVKVEGNSVKVGI